MADGERTQAEPAAAPAPTGTSERATAHAAAGSEVADRSYDLRFELLFAEIYLADRAAWLRALDRAATFATLASGTAVVGTALGAYPAVAWGAGLLMTLVGVGETVFDWAGRVTAHERQIDRLRNLRAELARAQDVGAIAVLDARRCALEPVESGTHHAVSALAWNQTYVACSAASRPAHCLDVPWHARLLRHVWRYTPTSFTTPAEREAAHAALEAG